MPIGDIPFVSVGSVVLSVLISHIMRRESQHLNLLYFRWSKTTPVRAIQRRRRKKREGEVACKKRHGGVGEFHGEGLRIELCYGYFRALVI